MRADGIAFALFLGSLVGCTAGTPASTAVEAAPKQIADNHRFEVNGNLVVDSQTGKVWKYDGQALVPVAYQSDSPLESVVEYVRDPQTHKLVRKKDSAKAESR